MLKIYPKEIEDILNAWDRIEDAAVVGMPDERFGERVCAYVVSEGDGVTLEEVKQYFEEIQAVKYMCPEFLINLAEMPMTPTGKVKKAALQKDAAERSVL